ncbi:MAG TPA: DoxX family protein [Vicinamibacterales bacterium]|nr:DoxX family protein [Vicinamibacterales bacterium]
MTMHAADFSTQAHIFSRLGLRTIAYWVFTLLVVFENASGFLWGILHIEYLRVMLNHLGYPQYFGNILGPWQLAAAAALIAPGLPLLKEWAYAGTFFNYSSGLVSHLAVGDGPRVWMASVVFAVFTVCSWALRPADRRLPRPTVTTQTTIWSWIVPLVVIGLMMVLACFTLPDPPKF